MFLGTASRLSVAEVELLIGQGGVKTYRTQINSEYLYMLPGSEGLGAKVQVREGKNPDYQLRSLSVY